jgi:hypothetical protein
MIFLLVFLLVCLSGGWYVKYANFPSGIFIVNLPIQEQWDASHRAVATTVRRSSSVYTGWVSVYQCIQWFLSTQNIQVSHLDQISVVQVQSIPVGFQSTSVYSGSSRRRPSKCHTWTKCPSFRFSLYRLGFSLPVYTVVLVDVEHPSVTPGPNIRRSGSVYTGWVSV